MRINNLEFSRELGLVVRQQDILSCDSYHFKSNRGLEPKKPFQPNVLIRRKGKMVNKILVSCKST